MQQLIYSSAAVRPFKALDLHKILAAARKYNARHTITGMMVYHARSFLQVLEGPDDAIEALFVKIRRDPRHTALRVIACHIIDKKEFESWPLGLVENMKKGPNVPVFTSCTPIEIMSLDCGRAKSMLGLFQRGPWRRLADH
jgi:hypothetical protein